METIKYILVIIFLSFVLLFGIDIGLTWFLEERNGERMNTLTYEMFIDLVNEQNTTNNKE